MCVCACVYVCVGRWGLYQLPPHYQCVPPLFVSFLCVNKSFFCVWLVCVCLVCVPRVCWMLYVCVPRVCMYVRLVCICVCSLCVCVCVCAGPTESAIEYFEGLGLYCPPRVNPPGVIIPTC